MESRGFVGGILIFRSACSFVHIEIAVMVRKPKFFDCCSEFGVAKLKLSGLSLGSELS